MRLQDVRPVKHQPPFRRGRRAGPAVAARRGGRGRRGWLPGPSRGGAVSAPGCGRGRRAGLEHQAVQASVQVLPVPACRCTAAACHALAVTRRGRICLSCASRTGVPILPRAVLLRCPRGAPGRSAGRPGLQFLLEQRLRLRHVALPGAPSQESCSRTIGEQAPCMRPRGLTCSSCSVARSLKCAACSAAAPAWLPRVRLSAFASAGHPSDMVWLLVTIGGSVVFRIDGPLPCA